MAPDEDNLDDNSGSDPSRFAGTSADVVPLKFLRSVDLLTPEERAQNVAHDEALKAIFAAQATDEPPANSKVQTDAAHHLHSSLREKIVEHVFVGEALRTLWRRGVFDAEVLRSEFDAYGYDLVMGRGKIIRHIQFKTGVRDRPLRVSIPVALKDKPSGCVIWIQVDNGLTMRRFWWFGAGPGEPLPSLGDRVAKRIGRTAEGVRPIREGHRVLNGSQFTLVETIEGVLEILFGPLPTEAPPFLEDENVDVVS